MTAAKRVLEYCISAIGSHYTASLALTVPISSAVEVGLEAYFCQSSTCRTCVQGGGMAVVKSMLLSELSDPL